MAVKSIRKYVLKLVPKQVIKVDPDAIILAPIRPRWSEPVLYILGDHKPLNAKITIRMFGTTVNFQYDPATMQYLGNFQNDTDTYHFFKVVEAE